MMTTPTDHELNACLARVIGVEVRRGKWDACFMCHHKFIDGEMMGLANTDKTNRPLCAGCCDEIERKEGAG